MDEYITTEDLAADLNTTRQVIYETRRRNDYPGRLGHRRGKRLMFQRSEITDWLESVPKITTDGTGVVIGWETDPAYGDGETTNDANAAIVWALEGIKKTLDAIHNELRAQRHRGTSPRVVVMASGTADQEAIQYGIDLLDEEDEEE